MKWFFSVPVHSLVPRSICALSYDSLLLTRPPRACNCTGISTNENAFLLQLCFPSPTERELHSASATVRHFIRLLSDVYFSCSLLIYENVGELSFRNARAFSSEGTKNLYWATINGFLMQNWMKFFFPQSLSMISLMQNAFTLRLLVKLLRLVSIGCTLFVVNRSL